MRLFKKQKKSEGALNPVTDKVAGRIARAGIWIQARFASNMNNLFASMKPQKLKIVLLLFCVACGGYSLYLIGEAITSQGTKQSRLKIEQVRIPKHLNNSNDEMMQRENTVDEQTYQKIQQFKRYMDSLKTHDGNKYDSILAARPFLMDTVVMMEEIYYSQKQNEVYEK
jgi:hypothetical protein